MIDSGVLRRVGNAAAEGPALTRTGLEAMAQGAGRGRMVKEWFWRQKARD